MGSWNIETPSSGPRKPKHGWKPLVGSPRKGGRDSARTPQRGSLRPPRFPTVHATDSRNRRSLGLALTAVGGSRPYETGTIGYSTKCMLWDSANFAMKLSEKSWRCPNRGLTREVTKGTLSKQMVALRTHRATGSDRHSIDHELVLTAAEGWLIGKRPLPGGPSSAHKKERE
jgi:hypothetical protein